MLTINELSTRYKIDINKLRVFEKNGLLTELKELDDRALKELSTMCTLYDSGLSIDDIRRFFVFYRKGESAEQINLLSLCRHDLLDEIHKKQRSLDSLDYIIYEIKKNNQICKEE